MAQHWLEQGAERLHIVDLNGAVAGKPKNELAIREIVSVVGEEVPVQLGGGIRDLDTIERYLDDGITYVIIGTAAVKNPGFLHDACYAFPGHIIVGLDARDGKVATDGWSKMTGHDVIDLAHKFEDYGVEAIVYTDIGRDGMLTGVNIEATVHLARAIKVPVIASGGLASSTTSARSARTRPTASSARSPGRALYEGTLDFKAAVEAARRQGDRIGGPRRPPTAAFARCLAKRIIPCLDVAAGRVVKGVNFVDLRDAGDPVEVARRYDERGRRRARVPRHPRERRDARAALRHDRARSPTRCSSRSPSAAASARSTTSARCSTPAPTRSASTPRPCSGPSSSARRRRTSARSASSSRSTRSSARSTSGRSCIHGGRTPTGIDAVEWAREVAALGAGEILLTSMDRDGAQDRLRPRADARGRRRGRRPGHRLGRRRHARAPGRGHPARAAPTPCSPRRSSTTASTRSRRRRRRCARPASRFRLSARWSCAVDSTTCAGTPTASCRRRAGRASGRVLTLAWMNREALERTASTGEAHYWSRSRSKLWRKGEASGHVQRVREIRLDCDDDAILLVVEQVGGIACHTGRERCFYQRLDDGAGASVEPVLRDPKDDLWRRMTTSACSRAWPRRSRRGAAPIRRRPTSRACSQGRDAILKKIGEEATETVMASKDGVPDARRRRDGRPVVPLPRAARAPRARARGRPRRARAARGPLGARREGVAALTRGSGRAARPGRPTDGDTMAPASLHACTTRTASSARSSPARSRAARRTRTARCWRSGTSVRRRRCTCCWSRRSTSRRCTTARRADEKVLGRMLALAPVIAKAQGAGDGFRTIINTGRVGRQDVMHIHIHVIGGPEPLGAMLPRKES